MRELMAASAPISALKRYLSKSLTLGRYSAACHNMAVGLRVKSSRSPRRKVR